MIFFREDVAYIVIESIQEKIIIENVSLCQIICLLSIILLKTQTKVQSSASHCKTVVQHGFVMTDVLMNYRKVVILFKTAFRSNTHAVTRTCNRKVLKKFTSSTIPRTFNNSHF